jgi:hypothetical protein
MGDIPLEGARTKPAGSIESGFKPDGFGIRR